MAKEYKLEDYDRVLMVEGYSDLNFHAELLEKLGKGGRVFIRQFNGKQDLATKLETFLTPQLLATKAMLGVIVDADTSAQGTATRFEAVLSKITGQSVASGRWTIGKPKVGLFVTPDGTSNGENGEIETLVWRAWSDDPANLRPRECIMNFVACMEKAGFKAHSPDKGFVSALLAIRNDEDPRLGPGAQANVFDFSRPEFEPLKQFLSGF